MNPLVRSLCRVLVFLLGGLSPDAFGDTSWINPASGLWRDPANWSFGVPNVSQPASHIAFGGGSKTVLADPATPATNLVVQRLNLSGPGVTNTLSLTGVVLEVRSTLEMRAGSALHIVDSTLRLPSTGSSLDINAGEVWLASGAIEGTNVSSRIGRDGGMATVRVDGGTARLSETLLGRRVSRDGAQGTLLLSGGLVEIVGNLDIGADTNCVGQVVVTGGELVALATNSSTAVGEQGYGTLTVSNGVVRFDDVDVGRHAGVIGTFHVAGGSNWVDSLSLARFPLSTGVVFQTAGRLVADVIQVGQEGRGEMTISGGSVLAETLQVAGLTNTASGTLVIDDGAALVRSNFVVGTSISSGDVLLTGGTVTITNESSSASLLAAQGTINISGGSLVADQLRLPSAAGRVSFNYGLLSSANTVVSNGAPFVVGDGTNAATFHLRGGTHYFQNGLVLSSNATLTGCGIILGQLSNEGTIATNCGPPSPLLINPRFSAGEFSFSFQSEVGFDYTVEHAAAVDAVLWDQLLVTNGTGNGIIIRDSPASGGNRFYRLRVQ